MSYNPSDFLLSNYDYNLPQNAIAQNPANPRENAKLLVYERSSGRIIHSDFYHFCDFVPQDTLIVMNDTKVLKARIYAHKLDSNTQSLSQKKYEIFFHKALDCVNPTNHPASATRFLAQIKGRVKIGSRLVLSSESKADNANISHTQHSANPPIIAEVKECLRNGLRVVCFMQGEKILSYLDVLSMLEVCGHIPLPPYIKRDDSLSDETFYQSVFAHNLGSIAAPTASLHFSERSLESLQNCFETCFITLHIGAGTFMSVESDDIRQHEIHTETYSLEKNCANAIENARKVLCVGTTSARCVEHYMRCKSLSGECDMFLYPSVEFKRVDYLLTNFHLPKAPCLCS